MGISNKEHINNLKKQISILERSIQHLENRAAKHGSESDSPLDIFNQLQDLREELTTKRAELDRLQNANPSGRLPYLGLSAFHEKDADLFFGRDILINEMIRKLEGAGFLAVLGPSGSGKSSAVLAGLIPALKRGGLLGSADWSYLDPIKPGNAPFETLALMLEAYDGSLGKKDEIEQSLQKSEIALLQVAYRLGIPKTDSRLVLVVNQGEELWTLVSEASLREQFINMLLTACKPHSPLLVILTMRADFLHRAAESHELARAIGEHLIVVSPMEPKELQEAITEPAYLVGGDFEARLVEELVQQTSGREGALPLLEHTLRQLWEFRHPDGSMTWEAYNELGGVEGALAQTADEILKKQTDAQKDELRHILLRLVQPGEGTADTRRRVPLVDLVSEGRTLAHVREIVQPFVNKGLLTTSGNVKYIDDAIARENSDRVGGELSSAQLLSLEHSGVLEITHEALITTWTTFRQWIIDHRTDLLEQLRLEGASKDWQQHEQSADFIWSGLRLEIAEAWLLRAQPLLNEREQHFLADSRAVERARKEAEDESNRERIELLTARAEAERQRADVQQKRSEDQAKATKRLYWLGSLLVLIVVLAVIAAIYAISQQRIADARRLQAESQSLATQAIVEAGRDPELALLLSMEAVKRDPSVLAEDSLRQALQAAPITLHAHSFYVYNAAYSPDGRSIVTSGQRVAKVWDAQTGQERLTLKGHTALVTRVVYSPDGKNLVTASQDTTAKVWDAQTGQERLTLKDHTKALLWAAYSTDGRSILTAGLDKTARVWDAQTGALRLTLQGHTDAVSSATYSPDGLSIVTTSWDKTAKVWDAQTGQARLTFTGHSDVVRTANFSPDGESIVTTSLDKTAKVWDAQTGQMRLNLAGHLDRVTSAVYSQDGHFILTASGDKTAKIWDSRTGEVQITFNGHEDAITSAVYSLDGHSILTASRDGTVKIWNIQTGQSQLSIDAHPARVWSAIYSPDGQSFVTAGQDLVAKVWDARTLQLRMMLEGHTASLTSATYSPDGKTIATTSGDKTIKVWDAQSGKNLLTLQGHTDTVFSAAYSPDSRYIVSGGRDKTARVWDSQTGKQIRLLDGHTDWISRVVYSPDGLFIATASNDNTVKIWEAQTGKLRLTLNGINNWLLSVAYSPDGKNIITGDANHRVKVWDSETGIERLTLTDNPAPGGGDFLSSSGADVMNDAEYSPDGGSIVTASGDQTVKVWDAKTGILRQTLRGHTASVSRAVYSPDGGSIMTAGSEGTVKIWSVQGTSELSSLHGHRAALYSAAYSPDSRSIVTASDDKTAKVWDAQSGEVRFTLKDDQPIEHAAYSPDGHTIITVNNGETAEIWDAQTGVKLMAVIASFGSLWCGIYSPDGKSFITAGADNIAKVWDAQTGKERLELIGHNDTIYDTVYSPDGGSIVTASGDGTAKIWDAKTGKLRQTLNGHTGWLYGVAYSSDGHFIVTASKDNTAKVWDAQTGQNLMTLTGHSGPVSSAMFSPDGHFILTSSFDGTIRIWNAQTGEVRSTLRGHTNIVTRAAYSPDGNRIVTASFDTTARQYFVNIDDLLQLAHSRVTRQFTAEERAKFLGESVSAPEQ